MTGRKPILVTGSHRSGSTWIGKMIACAPGLGYIHEPFNPNHNAGRCSANFEHLFEYITEKNQDRYREPIRRTIEFRYDLAGGIKAARTVKQHLLVAREWIRFFINRLNRRSAIIKDPFAFFSAEWLSTTFGMRIVVVSRHPAAFASSILRLGWRFDFSNLLNQPLLINDYLYPFESQLSKYAKNEYQVIDQAILLWRVIHHVIKVYQERHADWIFVRHEDISRDPLARFKTIYGGLGLEFTPRARSKIRLHSRSTNLDQVPSGEDTMFIRLNSSASIHNWKKRLTHSEVNKVREAVEDISYDLYSDEDW